MAKKKTIEELKADRNSAKEELKVAETEFKSFCKEKKLDAKVEEAPAEEKVAKRWTKLKDMVKKKQEAYDAIKTEIETAKAEKPEKAPRALKYEYPEGATADDKKKIRTEARAAAKRAAKEAAKGAKPEKAEKAEKSEKKKGKEGKKKEKEEVAEPETETVTSNED